MDVKYYKPNKPGFIKPEKLADGDFRKGDAQAKPKEESKAKKSSKDKKE